mmetsp:Transcript_22220/g.39121  ORF Transcript_22220/g.39121 Transcript_22220/m.39121 type:complete len:275 (-) Transcript_22220:20-844(-)
MPPEPSDGPPAVKLVIFDFDQTLSTVHVFKMLAGWEPRQRDIQVSKPYSCTQIGQMTRLSTFNTDDNPKGLREFATKIFGGPDRLAELDKLLKGLAQHGVETRVCTRGFVGTVKMLLHAVGLLQYFPRVHGVVEGKYTQTEFDKLVNKSPKQESLTSSVVKRFACMCAPVADKPKPAGATVPRLSPEMYALRGLTADGQWGSSKTGLMNDLISEKSISPKEALIVDDDERELADARCEVLHVSERQGLTHEQCLQIARMAGAQAAEEESACVLS